MKDLDSTTHSDNMVTTSLDRMQTLSFPSGLSPRFSGGYPRTLVHQTDWGPSGQHHNPDELDAAMAIAQLGRQGEGPRNPARSPVSPTPLNLSRLTLSTHENNSETGHVVKGKGSDLRQAEIKKEPTPMRRCAGSADFSSFVIKVEPTYNEYKEDIDTKHSNLNKGDQRCSSTDGGHYVKTCQNAMTSNRSCSNLNLASDYLEPRGAKHALPTMMTSTFTNSGLTTSTSPHWVGGNSSTEHIPTKNFDSRLNVPSDRGFMFPQGIGGLPSSVTRLISQGMNFPSLATNSDDILKYQNHPEMKSPQRSPVLPRRSPVADVKIRDRYDSPTNLLRRKFQYSVEARRRYQSDDSGLIKTRILKGTFGSLTAIEAYIKQQDLIGYSRLALDDSAIDLSTRRRVNKRRLSDDGITTQRNLNDRISRNTYNDINSIDRISRDTDKTIRRFAQQDETINRGIFTHTHNDTDRDITLTSSKQHAAAGHITTQLRPAVVCLRQSSSEPNSLYDLDRLYYVPGTSTTTISNTLTSTTAPFNYPTFQLNGRDNDNYDLVFKQEVKELAEKNPQKGSNESRAEFSTTDDVAVNRKSRSPIFQLPDSQLPPKKRRLLAQNNENFEEKDEEINKMKMESENDQPEVKFLLGDDTGVSAATGDRVVTAEESRDGLLSAVRPDEDGDLPLHIAVVQGRISTAEKLLGMMKKLAISVNSANNLKQTALHLAVIANQPEAVTLLLEEGASPHLTDRQGNTPVHLAVKFHYTACLVQLLKRFQQSEVKNLKLEDVKQDLNTKNFEGVTPLHLAVQCSNLEGLQQLITAGAAVNAQEGKNGRTALYFATEMGDLKAAKLLLENGADSSLHSYSGCSPSQAAAGQNRQKMVQLMETYNILNS